VKTVQAMCLVSQAVSYASVPWLYRNVTLDMARVENIQKAIIAIGHGKDQYLQTILVPVDHFPKDYAQERASCARLAMLLEAILPTLRNLRRFT